jgi:gp16 family phage-associated protein
MRTNTHKSEQIHPAARDHQAPAQLSSRHQAAKDWFVATGTSVAEWSKSHGFNSRLVHHILNGRNARRGVSHQIAVMLGIKDAVSADIGPVVKPKRGGGRK